MTLKHMLCLAALGCLASCSLHGIYDIRDSQNGIEGNEEIVSKRVDVDVFDSIHSHGSVDVEVVIAPNSQRDVRIICDSNLMDYIEVRSDGSSLVIDEHARINPSGNCVVEVNTPVLTELETTGSSDIAAAGSTRSIVVSSSGSGTIDSRSLAADTADAQTTSSGNLRIQASASVKIRGSGSGDVDVWGIPVERNVQMTGSGDIAFH